MGEEKRQSSIDFPGVLFVLMIWRVLPAKFVAIFAGASGESITMAIVVVVCVVAYLGYLIFVLHGQLPGGKALLVPFVGLALLGVSVLINSNEWNTMYLTYYVRYVFFTLFFLLCVSDYQFMVRLFSRFSLITFIVLGWQPIVKSNVFANWMDYGFTVALPCTIGLYAFAKEKKSIILWGLTITSIFMAIAFANRSTWICIALYIAIYEMVIEKNTIKKTCSIVAAFMLVVVVACYYESILDWLIEFNYRFNYNSHSLIKFKQLLSGATFDVFMSGRQELAYLAMNEIKKSFPFGSGVGHYETLTGVYSHNIIFDFLLYWGVAGIVVGFLIIFRIFKDAIMDNSNASKKLKMILICLWFPKLLFSGSFTYDLAFWAGVALAFTMKKNDNDEFEGN